MNPVSVPSDRIASSRDGSPFGRPKRVSRLLILSTLIPLLAGSHLMAYRAGLAGEAKALRSADEVNGLADVVGRAQFYLGKGPDAYRAQYRRAFRSKLDAGISVAEQMALPRLRDAGSAEEVARLEKLVAEAANIRDHPDARP